MNGSENSFVSTTSNFSVSNKGSLSIWAKPSGVPADWSHTLGWSDPSIYIQATTKKPYFQIHVGGSNKGYSR